MSTAQGDTLGDTVLRMTRVERRVERLVPSNLVLGTFVPLYSGFALDEAVQEAVGRQVPAPEAVVLRTVK